MSTAPHHRYLADDDGIDSYAPIGVDGLLAASEKVLGVSRGVEDPDDRDALYNDRVHTVDRLMAERVKLDHGRALRQMMGRLSRARSLTPLAPDSFSGYTIDYLKGNPLAPAPEEINPMHLLEQRRRITKMGPGGIGDRNAVTTAMQCHSADTEVFTRSGWKFWPDVSGADELACRVDGRLEFHRPESLHAYVHDGDMLLMSSRGAGFLVTMNHRFWVSSDARLSDESWRWETAEDLIGRYRTHKCLSAPYLGSDGRTEFELPPADPARGGEGSIRRAGPIDMGDWCEYLGWYCAEGSRYHDGNGNNYTVTITQCPVANPEKVARIKELMDRLPFHLVTSGGRNFRVNSKDLFTFVDALGGCREKTIPEFLFEVRPEYRRRFLDAFLAGDGWTQKSGSGVYSSSSEMMIDQIERLLISLGSMVTRGTPWTARNRDGSVGCRMYRTNELTSKNIISKPEQLQVVPYRGEVFCATVPGSLLLTRRGATSRPIWTGNSVHASQFGFIDPIAGPECFDAQSEVYTRRGWVRWDNVADDDVFACQIDGRLEWHPASRVVRAPYEGELIVAENKTLRMAITPNHRVVHKRDYYTKSTSVALADELEGSSIWIPARHEPEVGDPSMTLFTLPPIHVTNPNQKVFEPFDISDWCAYMGWFLSEGNVFVSKSDRLSYESGCVCVTQCQQANPENYEELRELTSRMGICNNDNGKTFLCVAKQFLSYFKQWDQGCYHKWIPEELFSAPVYAREELLGALLKGDGRWRSNRMCYCTVSEKLAQDVERLAFSLGYSAYIREEKDSRPEVTTTNYVVAIHRPRFRQIRGTSHYHSARDKTYPSHWRREPYSGVVYCATVPGGLLHVRGKKGTSGYWSGNSELAGIDVRLAHGARIGNDGKVYQLMRDRKLGKMRWVSPDELRGRVLKLPD